jgi:hypothetical protein
MIASFEFENLENAELLKLSWCAPLPIFALRRDFGNPLIHADVTLFPVVMHSKRVAATMAATSIESTPCCHEAVKSFQFFTTLAHFSKIRK